MKKLKVLFISANPDQTPPLKLDEEFRSITQKIRASDHRESIEITSVWAARPDDLIQHLNEYKPQVVHFSGHGKESGEIVLVDGEGKPKPTSPKAMKHLFESLKGNIQLVVLNACHTHHLARAIADVVGCTVSMNTAIGDKAAEVFAASFYRAIGFGKSVQNAFDQGKAALLMDSISEDQTPELITGKSINASNLILLTSSPEDIELLKDHRIAFERNAFRVPCIEELSVKEIVDAVDDINAFFNTGTLYSITGKLLKTSRSKNDYQSNEIKSTFETILEKLSQLKRSVISFLEEVNRYSFHFSTHQDFYNIICRVLQEQKANPLTVRSLVSKMDGVDDLRNQILRSLNGLLLKYNLPTFTLIQPSSKIIKEGEAAAFKEVVKHL